MSLSDFQKLMYAGFNVVRIPVGYWSYIDVGEPYTFGAAEYLDRAIQWARETGMKVIIDLHGAPKSQNGFNHSGHKLRSPGWGEGDSIDRTHEVLKIIGEKCKYPPGVKCQQDTTWHGVSETPMPLGKHMNEC